MPQERLGRTLRFSKEGHCLGQHIRYNPKESSWQLCTCNSDTFHNIPRNTAHMCLMNGASFVAYKPSNIPPIPGA